MNRRYTWLGNCQLKGSYHIEIINVESSDGSVNRHVEFHSSIHKNMPVRLTFCFSSQFTDGDILRDHNVMTKFIEHFGADALTVK